MYNSIKEDLNHTKKEYRVLFNGFVEAKGRIIWNEKKRS